MPIKIPKSLPAYKTLENENIFVMDEERADTQDIRPLKILILNLMPTKIETENQLLRLLSNSPLQIDIDLLQTETYTSKNTSAEHLSSFYKRFSEIKDKKYDGMIITGAPVEKMRYSTVDYWDEFCQILDWSKKNVFSVLNICWAAQAALYHDYKIKNHLLDSKMFGIFSHDVLVKNNPITRGFDDKFMAPHSRHTGINEEDIINNPNLDLLATSDIAGPYLICDKSCRQIYVTGHPEYDRETLSKEYFRDVDKGLPIEVPQNYFPGDDSSRSPIFTWKSHASLLYSNWLNYFVYQNTPFDLNDL